MNNGISGWSAWSLSGLKERIKASPVAHRIAHGAFWSLIGTLLARGLSVIASIVVARMLGKVGFGEFGIIQSTILNLIIFISYGLGMTATKHIAEFKSTDPTRAGKILALSGITASVTGVVLAGGVFWAAPLLAERVLAAPHLAGLLKVGALYLFLNALNGAQTGALAGFEAFRAIARINLVTGIATFVCLVGGVLLNGLYGAVWGLALSTAVSWLAAHLALRREAHRYGVPISCSGIGAEWKILMGFSLPAILGSVLNGPVNWICSAMLVNEPGGYAQMGLFNAANQWFALILFLPGLLSQVVLPMLSESVGAGDHQHSQRILRLTILANTLVVVPLVLFASLASPWIMSLYGDGFSASWPVLIVTLVTGAVLAVQFPVNQLLNASGKLWVVFFLNLWWAVLFVGFNSLMVDKGALGLVTARLIAYLLQGLAVVLLVRSLPVVGEQQHNA